LAKRDVAVPAETGAAVVLLRVRHGQIRRSRFAATQGNPIFKALLAAAGVKPWF
jgi:hypothetical protein